MLGRNLYPSIPYSILTNSKKCLSNTAWITFPSISMFRDTENRATKKNSDLVGWKNNIPFRKLYHDNRSWLQDSNCRYGRTASETADMGYCRTREIQNHHFHLLSRYRLVFPSLFVFRGRIRDQRSSIISFVPSGTHGVIVVYDVTNGESFGNVKRWLMEIDTNCENVQKILGESSRIVKWNEETEESEERVKRVKRVGRRRKAHFAPFKKELFWNSQV